MLLYLANLLTEYESSFRVFQYLTFRSILGTLTALMISFMVGPVMIRRLSAKNIGQSVRDLGPESHFVKSGTPTMGGTLILVAISVSTLLWADWENRYIWAVLFVTLGLGVVGFIDDYRKISDGNSKGLAARSKLFWQSLIAVAASVFLFKTSTFPAETQFIVPFFKTVMIDMGWAYVVLSYFVIVGTSNAVNLTDGLDGLAIMPVPALRHHPAVEIDIPQNIRFHQTPGLGGVARRNGFSDLHMAVSPVLDPCEPLYRTR